MKKAVLSWFIICLSMVMFIPSCGKAAADNEEPISAVNKSNESPADADSPDEDASAIEEMLSLIKNVVPASESAACDGFGELEWGHSFSDLPQALSWEVVQRGADLFGYGCSAYYSFDAEGALIQGVYRLNENLTLNRTETLKMFLTIRNCLQEEYGLPDELQNREGPDLETLIRTGEGTWDDMWTGVSSNNGKRISVILSLQNNGMVTVSYLAR